MPSHGATWQLRHNTPKSQRAPPTEASPPSLAGVRLHPDSLAVQHKQLIALGSVCGVAYKATKGCTAIHVAHVALRAAESGSKQHSPCTHAQHMRGRHAGGQAGETRREKEKATVGEAVDVPLMATSSCNHTPPAHRSVCATAAAEIGQVFAAAAWAHRA